MSWFNRIRLYVVVCYDRIRTPRLQHKMTKRKKRKYEEITYHFSKAYKTIISRIAMFNVLLLWHLFFFIQGKKKARFIVVSLFTFIAIQKKKTKTHRKTWKHWKWAHVSDRWNPINDQWVKCRNKKSIKY